MKNSDDIEKRIGALEEKVRQHQRAVTLCIVSVIILALSMMCIQKKLDKYTESLAKAIQIIVEEVQVP